MEEYDFEARYYDPQLGRWWAQDPEVQFASPYNGMGNNWPGYTDPDGRWVHIAVGAVVGGLVNLGTKALQGKIKSWGDGFAAFGIGAAAGAIGAATGGAAFTAAGGAAAGGGGFLAGMAGGAVGAAYSSPVQGIGNAVYFGDPYSPGQMATDIVVGGLFGGLTNGVVALFNNRNPLTGKVSVGNGLGLKGSVVVPEVEDISATDFYLNVAKADKVATINPIVNSTVKALPNAYSRFSRFEHHFAKHAKEYGGITKDAYYKRAPSLLEGPVGGDVVGFKNSAGYTFRMNMRTGEFGMMRPDGIIETFFRRLREPAKYWATQIATYGN